MTYHDSLSYNIYFIAHSLFYRNFGTLGNILDFSDLGIFFLGITLPFRFNANGLKNALFGRHVLPLNIFIGSLFAMSGINLIAYYYRKDQ